MNEDTGVHYINPLQLNETVVGLGGIGRVMASRHPEYKEGEVVMGMLFWPWKRYFNVDAEAKKDNFQKVGCTIMAVNARLC